jgi:hypothetical protein
MPDGDQLAADGPNILVEGHHPIVTIIYKFLGLSAPSGSFPYNSAVSTANFLSYSDSLLEKWLVH